MGLRLKFKEILIEYCLRHPTIVDIFKNILSHKPLVNSQFYKTHVLQIARTYAKKHEHAGSGVSIETTLNCNAKCIMCYHGVRNLGGTMNMDLFKKIIDDCLLLGINSVGLSVYGEPFCDKYFFDRVTYLRKHNMKYGFYTNGYLLNERNTNRLFELGGLSKINFSVCGYSKNVYETIMVGLKRDTVYKNILHFLKLKNANNNKNLTVVISTIKQLINRRDLSNFVKFWKRQKGVNKIIVADLWNRMGEKPVEKGEKIGRMHIKDNWQSPCKQLWGSVYVYWDGKVAPCCDDSDLRELIIGNVNNQTLKEVLTSEELKNLRRTHLNDKRSAQKICGRCFHNSNWFA